jgi:hypothetical protein
VPDQDPELFTARLFARWYRLRRTRPDLVPALLQEPTGLAGGKVWTFDNPANPWGSRTRLPIPELERMVNEAEQIVMRRDAGVQQGEMQEEGAA